MVRSPGALAAAVASKEEPAHRCREDLRHCAPTTRVEPSRRFWRMVRSPGALAAAVASKGEPEHRCRVNLRGLIQETPRDARREELRVLRLRPTSRPIDPRSPPVSAQSSSPPKRSYPPVSAAEPGSYQSLCSSRVSGRRLRYRMPRSRLQRVSLGCSHVRDTLASVREWVACLDRVAIDADTRKLAAVLLCPCRCSYP